MGEVKAIATWSTVVAKTVSNSVVDLLGADEVKTFRALGLPTEHMSLVDQLRQDSFVHVLPVDPRSK